MHFHSDLAENLYELTNEGYSDDTQGNPDASSFSLFVDFDSGKKGVINAILTETIEGDVLADEYPSKEAAQHAWDNVSTYLDETMGEPLDMGEGDE